MQHPGPPAVRPLGHPAYGSSRPAAAARLPAKALDWANRLEIQAVPPSSALTSEPSLPEEALIESAEQQYKNYVQHLSMLGPAAEDEKLFANTHTLHLRWSNAIHAKGHNPLASACGNKAKIKSECLREALASLVDRRYDLETKFAARKAGQPDVFAAPHGRQAVSLQQPAAAAALAPRTPPAAPAPAAGNKRPADGPAEPAFSALKSFLHRESALCDLHNIVETDNFLTGDAAKQLWSCYLTFEDDCMYQPSQAAFKPLLQPTRQHLAAAFKEFLQSCETHDSIGDVANLGTACAQLQEPALSAAFVEAVRRCAPSVKPNPDTPAAASIAQCGSTCVLYTWDVALQQGISGKQGLLQQLAVLTDSDNVAPKLYPEDLLSIFERLEMSHNHNNSTRRCFPLCDELQLLVRVFVGSLRRGDEHHIVRAYSIFGSLSCRPLHLTDYIEADPRKFCIEGLSRDQLDTVAEAFCALGYSVSAQDRDHTHPRHTITRIVDQWARLYKPEVVVPKNRRHSDEEEHPPRSMVWTLASRRRAQWTAYMGVVSPAHISTLQLQVFEASFNLPSSPAEELIQDPSLRQAWSGQEYLRLHGHPMDHSESGQAVFNQAHMRGASTSSRLQEEVADVLRHTCSRIPNMCWVSDSECQLLGAAALWTVDVFVMLVRVGNELILIAFEIEGPPHEVGPGLKFNGSTASRNAMLGLLGVRVVQVTYREWNATRTLAQREQLILSKLAAFL